jgi:hypothetical protein
MVAVEDQVIAAAHFRDVVDRKADRLIDHNPEIDQRDRDDQRMDHRRARDDSADWHRSDSAIPESGSRAAAATLPPRTRSGGSRSESAVPPAAASARFRSRPRLIAASASTRRVARSCVVVAVRPDRAGDTEQPPTQPFPVRKISEIAPSKAVNRGSTSLDCGHAEDIRTSRSETLVRRIWILSYAGSCLAEPTSLNAWAWPNGSPLPAGR